MKLFPLNKKTVQKVQIFDILMLTLLLYTAVRQTLVFRNEE